MYIFIHHMRSEQMRKEILFLFVGIFISSLAYGAGGIDNFLNDLNIQAQTDLNNFSLRISTQFGVPLTKVQAVVREVESPADAFMCFQLARMTHKPSEAVVREYQADKGKGWGVIAQRLGIKPGSAEFRALKAGDFVLDGNPGAGPKTTGKGKGKGRGNRK